MERKYEVLKFVDDEFELDVNVSRVEDTVWLNQDEIALLFDKAKSTINEHIKHVLKEELDEDTVMRKFGKTELSSVNTKPINYYNLDLILAVGYRVNSKRGIEFRRWSNKVLKEYLVQGYSINNKKLEKLNKVIDIQNKMLASALNIDNYELSEVIKTYTNALDLLDDYDHQRLENSTWGCPWKLAKAGLNKTGKTIVCGHWHTADFFNNLKNLKIKYDVYKNNPIFISKKYKLIGLDACTAATNKINVLVLNDNEL